MVVLMMLGLALLNDWQGSTEIVSILMAQKGTQAVVDEGFVVQGRKNK